MQEEIIADGNNPRSGRSAVACVCENPVSSVLMFACRHRRDISNAVNSFYYR